MTIGIVIIISVWAFACSCAMAKEVTERAFIFSRRLAIVATVIAPFVDQLIEI